jgi:hypothetical protein
MLNEHGTDTPKSLKRAQVKNLFFGNLLRGSGNENSREKLDRKLSGVWFQAVSDFKNKVDGKRRRAATEFILFRLGTSIIGKYGIFAGAHKWLLSTMS